MDFLRFKHEFFIEGKDDGQIGGPPNIEQPIVVQKKELKKKKNYGILSCMSGFLFNQKHGSVFSETGMCVILNILKSSYKLYVKKYVPDIALHNIPQVDKTDIVTGEIMIEVPILYGNMRNHHLIHMYVGEES